MFKKFFLSFLCLGLPLLAEVENSILPQMEQLEIRDLKGKISQCQLQVLSSAMEHRRESLRIATFNMLFNLPFAEENLGMENRWDNRKARLLEYFAWANADVVGSQELQKDQLEALMDYVGDRYDYYGLGVEDGKQKGDIPAIFYRKDRLILLEGSTFYFSKTPNQVSISPFGKKNTFTVCLFQDLVSQRIFKVVNTHLAFGNIERRHYEARILKNFLLQESKKTPLIVTGDFNTFPFRQELSLPFYDGECVLSIIEAGGVKDSQQLALFGHFGPISSTNFNCETNQTFSALGTPGVILDHIFVNKAVQVLSHGIDPAQVNGHWPSDHFPTFIEVLFQ